MVTPIFDPETGEVMEAGGPPPASQSQSSAQAMSLDEARALLVREHGTAIPNDDPILMLVTLHQGFVSDYEAMLHRHDEGIQGFLGATGEACAEAVENILASLKDKTVKASLDQAFALVERQSVAMDQLQRLMRRHAILHIILSLLTLTAAGLVAFVLSSFIR